MEGWNALFLSEMSLVVGSVLLGITLSKTFSGETLVNGTPFLFGTIFIFISVFLRLKYESLLLK